MRQQPLRHRAFSRTLRSAPYAPFGTSSLDIALSSFVLDPATGTALSPGSYSSGLSSSILRFVVDGGVPVLTSGFFDLGNSSTLTVQTADLPTPEIGFVYHGGRFTASMHQSYPDGGFTNFDVDAQGCDGQPLGNLES